MLFAKRWLFFKFGIGVNFRIGASIIMLPFFNPENFPFLTDWYYSSIMSGDSPPNERRELFEVHSNHGGGHSSNSVMVGTSTSHMTTTTTTQTDPSAQPLLPTHKDELKDKEDRDKDKDDDKDEGGGGGVQRVDANKPQGGGGSSEGARKKEGAGSGGGGGGDKSSGGGNKDVAASGANGTAVAIGVGTGADLMDGQIKPSSASATSGKTVNEIIEEEDCTVKCLYYTMQCCECVIT